VADADVHFHFPVEVEVRATAIAARDEWHFPVEVHVAPASPEPDAFMGAVGVTAGGAVVPASAIPLGPEAEAQLHFPVEIEVRAAPPIDEQGIADRTLARLVRALASGDGIS
jgi:hypothetical protein